MDCEVLLVNSTNKLTAIKVEIDDEQANIDASLLQADEVKMIDAPDTKCGDVLFGNRGILKIVCALCKEVFKNLIKFGIHIQETHIKLKDLNEYLGIESSIQDNDIEKDSFCNSPISEVFKQEDTIEEIANAPVSSADDSKNEINTRNETSTSKITRKFRRKTRSTSEIPDDVEREDGVRMETDASESENHQKKFSCNLCDSVYNHKNSLIRHSKKLHENVNIDAIRALYPSKKVPKTIIEEYQCSACNRVYSHNQSLLQHFKEMHREESVVVIKKAKVCKYCDKEFNNQQAYATHMQEIHPGNRKYTCPHCPKAFSSKARRGEHINTHTGECPFKCPHCSQAFKHSSNLSTHLLSHLKIRKYSCSLCGKLFVTPTDKRRHESTHTGEDRRQCDQCGKTYSNAYKLTEHIRRHQNIRNYKCEVCSKRFVTSTHLKQHMRMHSDERPFVCDICGQNFRYRGNLRTHRELHSDVKKYVCKICGKAFSQHIGLYSHRKSHGESG